MPIKSTYYAPTGGLPPQTQLLSDRAIFTEAYAIIPKRVLTDIVISYLPFWEGMRMWVIARPLSGFAETFSQYIVEVAPTAAPTSLSSTLMPKPCCLSLKVRWILLSKA